MRLLKEVIAKHPLPWVFVPSGKRAPNGDLPEDDSIYDANETEVIGCSEWMRNDSGLLQTVVELANEATL